MGLLDALTGNNSRIELEYIAYGCNGTHVALRGPAGSPYYPTYVVAGDYVFVSGVNAENA